MNEVIKVLENLILLNKHMNACYNQLYDAIKKINSQFHRETCDELIQFIEKIANDQSLSTHSQSEAIRKLLNQYNHDK